MACAGGPGWGEPLLDFLIWPTIEIGKKSSALKGRCAAIRFMHLANGDVDFSLQSHRAKDTIRGLWRRERVTRKQLFSADILRWIHRELVWGSPMRINGSGIYAFRVVCGMYYGYLLSSSYIGNRIPTMGARICGLESRKELIGYPN